MDNGQKLVNDIRGGVLDINGQELFYPLVLKGLLVDLRNKIKIRGKEVPHIITHTGDDRMWLEMRGYDNSIEPLQISNEDSIYNTVPRCNVNPGGISLDTAQLTSPYSIGQCQVATDAGVFTLKGEFRRTTIKMSVELKYRTESFTDLMELIQYVTSNLAFVRTYSIMYMGQKIECSYKIPDSFDGEHQMDIDGSLSDVREQQMTLSIEVETNMPIYSNRTMVLADKIITKTKTNITTD